MKNGVCEVQADMLLLARLRIFLVVLAIFSILELHCSNPPPPCNEAIHIRVLYNLSEGEKKNNALYSGEKKPKD
jgi:hypothetical protein